MHPQPQNSTAIAFVPGTESDLNQAANPLLNWQPPQYLTELSPYC